MKNVFIFDQQHNATYTLHISHAGKQAWIQNVNTKENEWKQKSKTQNIGNAVGTQYHQNTEQPDFIENITHRHTTTAEWVRTESKESSTSNMPILIIIIVFIRFLLVFFVSFDESCVGVLKALVVLELDEGNNRISRRAAIGLSRN